MKLKRDNWTNEEVIKILEGHLKRRENFGKGCDPEMVDNYMEYGNEAIEFAIMQFGDFMCPADDYSAMALNTEDGFIYHIGTMPPR